MCGWIVVIGRQGQPFAPEALSRAMASIVHRGPDDSGRFAEAAVSMGFQRLAILDVSLGGHQPMLSADGRFVMVFNGEIYNYRELKDELVALGASFRSTSDTEVLLAAWQQWGESCLERLNGMFAFVIHDRRTGACFAARDRLGEKPFYCWQDERWTVFASEPRAIGATGLVTLVPDWPRVAAALRDASMDHDAASCVAGVRQLPAGCSARVDRAGAFEVRPYWTLPADGAAEPARSEAAWIDEIGALVSDAVRLRMRSDVPVGFTVSGGIDSSLLICEAALLGHQRIDAFTYHDEEHDERSLVAATLGQTGAREHRVEGSELDIAGLLPAVVAANGELLHSLSPIANYALFGRARAAGVKVLLGGQTADEAFAGYTSFESGRWLGMALGLEWGPLLADVRASARLQGLPAGRLVAQVAARALRFALGRWAPYRALRQRHERARLASARHPVFSNDFWRTPPAGRDGLRDGPARLADHQRYALATWPLPLYLRVEDRVSMAHSVEARLPFADHRLVEHGVRLPETLKYAGGVNKVALRAVAARRVPAAVSAQVRKLGFPVGHGGRRAQGLRRLCLELAATRAFRERGLYDVRAVDALLAREAGPEQVGLLFDLAQTELWLTWLEGQRRAA